MLYFGDKLKALRLERKLTQEQLASKIGLVKATISAYEKSQKYPSVEVVIKLCEIFDVSADYLLGLSDKKTLRKHELTDEQLAIVQKLIKEFERCNN